MSDVREWIAPVFPAGVDRARRLLPLLHSAIWPPNPPKMGRDKRREAARDPLGFAMLYLPEYLADETTGAISFSQMHLDAYDRMMRWWDRGPDRSAWASHRAAGKSVVWFLVAPLYTAAYGLCDYCLMLSNTGDQVKDHLGTLKGVIEDGGLLVHDFPHLRRGRPWTVTDLRTVGGARFKAAGMAKSILGARDRERRPNLIVCDDLEPGTADWTTASKAKTLGRLVNDVLPAASPNAAVVLTGTPVATGSLMHDVVRAAGGERGALGDGGEWVGAHRFAAHHFPAIVDEGLPTERSAWETRHPIAQLRADRAADREAFALQMMCAPDDPAVARGWTDRTFRYAPAFDPDGVLWRIGSIDPAVTSGRSGGADHSAFVGIAVGRETPAGRLVCVEVARAGSWDEQEILAEVHDWARKYPRARKTLIVEGNQGGERWVSMLRPLPGGVDLEAPFYAQGSKSERIKALLADYRRGAVLHEGRFVKLESQMVGWRPSLTGHGIDDLIDATSAAVRRALYGDASRVPAGRGRRTR